MKNSFKAGFSRVQITPPLGIGLTGYFIKREAEKILDDLYINTVAFSAGEKTVVVISIDGSNMKSESFDTVRASLSEKFGLPRSAFFITFTHTHTGPYFHFDHERELERDYFKWVTLKIADSVTIALDDMKPATLGYGKSMAQRISFGRRYRMKDGTVRTNPGVKNPDIASAIGEIDESVSVVRIDREGAESIVILNFATHPDTIGGNVISADWPGFARSTLEAALGNVKCVMLNGAEGDVNHVNVFPKPGEENGLHKDFDDVDRGYEHAKHMGRAIAGAALQVYSKVRYVEVDSIDFKEVDAIVAANIPDPSEIPLAIKYNELHNAGKDEEIPYKGMMLTTVLANSKRIVRLQNGPESFSIPLIAFRLGNVVFAGISGEPFSGIGMAIKENNSERDIVIPCCITNGNKGYFPMMDSYVEGGYESASSSFKAGVAETIIEEATKLIKSI